MGKNTKVIASKGNSGQQKRSKPLFFFWLCLFLIFHSGCAIAQVAEIQHMADSMEKQRAHRKQSLEKLVQKPLTTGQQHLLTQLLDNERSLDQVLSSELYLVYLKEQDGQEYKDFSAYVAAMPTPKRKTAALFVLKSALPPKTDAEELKICANFYFKVRNWLPKGLDILDGTEKTFTEEFGSLFRTYLLDPMIEMYGDRLFGLNILGSLKVTQMGAITSLIAEAEAEVFHDTWRERLEKYGSREGLLRCAIASSDEFALMRSFFKDTAGLEKWILEPSKPPKNEKGPTKEAEEDQ